MLEYKFRFVSSYRGAVVYEVWNGLEYFRIEEQRQLLGWEIDYDRIVYHGSRAEYDRDVLGAIGTIHRCVRPQDPLPLDLVKQFNAWRLADHEAALFKMQHEPQNYGPIDPATFSVPAVVVAACYVENKGWVKISKA